MPAPWPTQPSEGERTFVGTMSGTSADGIDAVVVSLHGGELLGRQGSLRLEVLQHTHVPFEGAMRARVLALPGASPEELARMHVEVGRRFGEAARLAVAAAGRVPQQIAAVASAGITVVHRPPEPDDPGATLVLGDGDVMAETCGCAVLSELRARDRALGGHGAPLVPFADLALLHDPQRDRAALNIGGIANLTVVPAGGEVLAFDTGPGNMLLDGAIERRTDGRLVMDVGGALGLAGHTDAAWLERIMSRDAFLSRPPPRSTGRERYGAAWLDAEREALSRLSLEDLVATLSEYTVQSIVAALRDFAPREPEELVVSGGGAFNRRLMGGLRRELAPMAVRDSEEACGIPVLAKESVAFAILADATFSGIPASLPSVTGARQGALLGKLSVAPRT